MKSETVRTDTDVLVIGGGIAGLFAAIKAKESKPEIKVTLVDKATPGSSGCSVFAAGVFPFWQPGDDLEAYTREIIEENSEYLVDQDYVVTALQESYDRFRDLVEYGVDFARNGKGEFKRVPALATRYGYCTPIKGGGPHLMWKVRTRALGQGIELRGRTAIVELLTDGRRCVGAAGFDVRTGQFHVFSARATVLAAGTLTFNRAPMGSSGATGDGVALALRAGVELRNLEQISHSMIYPKNFGQPGLHIIFGSGGRMVNALNERFMERYNPVLKEEARRFETARAILNEWKEGRGPCSLDCTHLSPEAISTIKSSLPLLTQAMANRGQDISRDKIEYIPTSMSLLHLGGVRLQNADGKVNLEGLWVAGAAGDYCGGVESTAATALSGSSVQGARAGVRAADYASDSDSGKIEATQVERIEEQLYTTLGRKGGVRLDEVFHRAQDIAFQHINLLKEEKALARAISELGKLKEELLEVSPKDPHELRKLWEVRNIVEVGELGARASLMRTESRLAHFRLDYPRRDDRSWLKWIIVTRKNGETRLSIEEIPLKRWRYRPLEYEETRR